MTETPSGPVALELARARSSLEAAQLLAGAGLFADFTAADVAEDIARAAAFLDAAAAIVAVSG